MKISYNWLKEFVHLPDSITALEVAEKLKLSTVEVEGITELGASLKNMVVGKVMTCEKHPNADKLKVCFVDLGSETVQIVCGGSNVEAGMLVAVAKVGARVKWHGEGDWVELAPAKIRGVESVGMICGADEIGLMEMFLKKEEKEIVDLSVLKLKAGMPLAEALKLNDAILEIDNKSLSNRPDLWGHYGMAREVAVLTNRTVRPYRADSLTFRGEKGNVIGLKVSVENKAACPKYMAVAMSNIKVGSSPAWLKEKLAAVGVRSINTIVDATNFVMFDLGQPLHAFDRKVIGDKIVVRSAREGEQITTLDEKARVLSADMLVIANPDKILAVAGVMGGFDSSISDQTTEIIIEAANFEAASIRQTSTRLGLRSDSSARFEKSLDPNLCSLALGRVVALIHELCPTARLASKVVEVGKPVLFTGPLVIPVSFFEKVIGIAIPAKTIITILSRLGFVVKEKKGALTVVIPSWRATKDVSLPEDVVEEVVRIYGYEQIPATWPTFPIHPPTKNDLLTLAKTVQDILVKELSYTEVYNYSFVSGAQIAKLGDETSKYLELDNPISKEKPYIRRALLPNLLENASVAIAHHDELKIFEIGSVFAVGKPGPRAERNSDELLPRQDTWLTTLYLCKKDTTPFQEARRVAEMIFSNLHLTWGIAPIDKIQPWEHPTRLTLIACAGKVAGVVHELHPRVATAFGIAERVGVCSINLSTLADIMVAVSAPVVYQPISLYPEVMRDLAFLIKREVTHAGIVALLEKSDPLLKEVELFDVFAGKTVGEGKKSMAYHLTFGNFDRTLNANEVDAVEARIIKILQDKYGAEMRK